MKTWTEYWGGVSKSVAAALALLAPVHCSGCGEPDVAICDKCRSELIPYPHQVSRMGLLVWAGISYGRVSGSVIRAFKDDGRTDSLPYLVSALNAAITHAVIQSENANLEFCVVPSTNAAYRIRGYVPVTALLARCGIRPLRALQVVGEHADQGGLNASSRVENAANAFIARKRLIGRELILVDDVLTTGATLRDAVRALNEAGGNVVAIAVLAETPLRYDHSEELVS